jgi:carboxymethylenebutenolidase
MMITSEYVDVPAPDGGTIRTFVATPRAAGGCPGVLLYSDIFQLTGPMLRFCARLAGYGFVVAAPEIYRRIEPPGLVIPFDDAGRARGLGDAAQTPAEHFDEDCRSLLSYLTAHPAVKPGQLAAGGFCLGGHLAFRAALRPEVRATVCFYGTGIHNGKLGKDADAGSLQRASEIEGELLLVWGEFDPHIPEDGRRKVEDGLRDAGAHFSQRSYPAEHAFMRDEGARYDPQATDAAFSEMIGLYRRTFSD